MIKHYNIIGQY